MCRCIMRFFLLICLWTAATGPVRAESGPDNDPNDPRFVLEQIQKRLDAISNYQCTLITTPTGSREEKHLAYNRQGHSRIRETDDDRGVTSTIWDGARTIRIRERVKPNGTVVYSASILPGRYREVWRSGIPWGYLGGSPADW
jgi:TPP-dependent trihydroxycyclohexane-1,2-dione (THcHDO) dehydratase